MSKEVEVPKESSSLGSPPQRSPKTSFVTEAVILAALPAYVYFVTFMYETGYCTHFGIPSSLISPGLTSMLICAAAIGAVLLSTFNAAKIIGIGVLAVYQQRGKLLLLYPILFLNGTFLVILVIFIQIYGLSWKLLAWGIGVILIINALLLGLPMLGYKGTVKERYVQHLVSDDPYEKYDVDTWIMKKVGKRAYFLVFILLVIIAFSYFVGDGEARNQSKFFVISNRPDTVVLRTYGDMMICGKVDRTQKTLKNELTVLYMSKLDDLTLVKEEIGYLTIQKEVPVESKPTPISK